MTRVTTPSIRPMPLKNLNENVDARTNSVDWLDVVSKPCYVPSLVDVTKSLGAWLSVLNTPKPQGKWPILSSHPCLLMVQQSQGKLPGCISFAIYCTIPLHRYLWLGSSDKNSKAGLGLCLTIYRQSIIRSLGGLRQRRSRSKSLPLWISGKIGSCSLLISQPS